MVFIGKVHGRQSEASIRDKNQSKNDTCHVPLMLPDNLSDICIPDIVCVFNRQPLTYHRQPNHLSHQPMNIESLTYNFLAVTPIGPLSQ